MLIFCNSVKPSIIEVMKVLLALLFVFVLVAAQMQPQSESTTSDYKIPTSASPNGSGDYVFSFFL